MLEKQDIFLPPRSLSSLPQRDSLCDPHQTLACSILTALLSEFSSSSKTSSIGLSMEFHGSCKRLFQVCSSSTSSLHLEDGLRQIFMLTMEVLQEFSRRENLNAQMSSVFQRYLALANQVLCWNFLPPNHILSLCRRPKEPFSPLASRSFPPSPALFTPSSSSSSSSSSLSSLSSSHSHLAHPEDDFTLWKRAAAAEAVVATLR
ncbi:Exportin-4 [Liparis tanakae]|uniref:Exportin-4 n=1 Tax=Liparis tanakae TaxID=230148 RepID=A0A4Z2FUK6_9TELE|nr:Exportin-4 [Liparis tanakae]